MSDASTAIPTTGRQIRSLVTADGDVELSLADVDVPTPTRRSGPRPHRGGADQPVRSRAAVRWSRHGRGDGVGDGRTARRHRTDRAAGASRRWPAGSASRCRSATRAAAWSSPPGHRPRPRRCSAARSACSAARCTPQYRCVHVSQALALPDGVTSEQGAACFVNPLTALGNDRHDAARGPHRAGPHRGRLQPRPDAQPPVPRRRHRTRQHRAPARAGAAPARPGRRPRLQLVGGLVSSMISPTRSTATGATIAFDAIGGGRLAGQILTCMERAANARATEYSRYGSTSTSRCTSTAASIGDRPNSNRNFGMAWGVAGWLLTPYMISAGADEVARMRDRVAAEITTTFASGYTATGRPRRRARPRGDRGVRQAGHRHEVPDHSPRLSERDGVNALSAVRFGRLRR